MRKFIVQCKSSKATVSEVECNKITPLENPSVLFLKPGEYYAHIPSLNEVWCWFAFFETEQEAYNHAVYLVKWGLIDYAKAKHRPEATQEEIDAAIAGIQIKTLPL